MMAAHHADAGLKRADAQGHGHWGAQLLDARHTRFRLWAPDCDRIWLDVSSREPQAMSARENGFFETVAPVGAGACYGYRLDTPAGLFVPDPASRAQQDGVEACSRVVDPHAYPWRCTGWHGRPWHEAVLMEVHAGVLGGFDGVRRHLDAWTDLGITAIELMPVNAFLGRRNWGYDGTLIYAPDTSYGTPEQLKALVDAAHERGLMLLLDVVYNHFGPHGNFLPRYASAFFRDDHPTPWGPAVDFRRSEVRDFVVSNALYWLNEFRFDGLRLDAAHSFEPQSFLEEFATRVHAEVDPGRHVHLTLEHRENAAHLLDRHFRAQWNDDFHHAVHVILTQEYQSYYRDYEDDPVGKLARTLAEGFAFQGQMSPHLGRPRGEPCAHLPPTCFIDFLQNHDQVGNRAMGERLQSLAPAAAVDAALSLLLLAPQVPMLFMGEDVACTHPFLYFTDYAGDLADAVRTGRRREFADFDAFSDPEARERIPDPNAVETFAATRCDEAADSLANARRALLRTLLELRRREVTPWLAQARHARCDAYAESLCLHWPRSHAPAWVVAANLGRQPASLPPVSVHALFESMLGATRALAAGRLPPFAVVAGPASAPGGGSRRHE